MKIEDHGFLPSVLSSIVHVIQWQAETVQLMKIDRR